jgi:hypothetical protein
MAYKRNQVIDAIETALASGDRRPPSQIATRLKRLLHADRLLERSPRSKTPEQSTYAFFSGKLAGSGNENLYSPFEAFALFLGIRLLDNGFPQRTVVRILRSIRGELENGLAAEWRRQERIQAQWYLARLAPEGSSSDSFAGTVSVCRGEVAVANLLKRAREGQIMTVIELTGPMRRFKAAIETTLPVKRGRR